LPLPLPLPLPVPLPVPVPVVAVELLVPEEGAVGVAVDELVLDVPLELVSADEPPPQALMKSKGANRAIRGKDLFMGSSNWGGGFTDLTVTANCGEKVNAPYSCACFGKKSA
jgi:hypothetical protein